ncbi:hypothetical protein SFRURICE_018258 [Spodoptera frugiperda]|nr:hypothetical protein SFRURICE_018258 [Spodoptera frugiperda]
MSSTRLPSQYSPEESDTFTDNIDKNSHLIDGDSIAIYLPGTFPDSVVVVRNFRKTEKSPVILRPTRESNPRPLARQSHLQPLGQRGIMLAEEEAGRVREQTSSRPSRRERHSGHPEPDPCVRRVAFRVRIIDPSDHHRWG